MSAPLHLVTGAGSGIGAALVRRLHERGDRLCLLARSAERADELASEFPGADTVVADLAAPGAVAAIEGLPERLDSLVHVAGAVELAPVAELSEDHLRTQLEVNLVAPMLLTRACLPALRAARGQVVVVNSTSGLSASGQWSAYAGSKYGARGFADALRQEEAEHGVRVTSVFPSRTATPMQAKVHEQEGRDYDPSRFIQPASVADTIVHVLDLPRDGTIREVTVGRGPG